MGIAAGCWLFLILIMVTYISDHKIFKIIIHHFNIPALIGKFSLSVVTIVGLVRKLSVASLRLGVFTTNVKSTFEREL